MIRIDSRWLMAPLVLVLAACAKPSYVVAPAHQETERKKIDAEWFTRDVYDGSGLAAVELVYCPLQPEVELVCRTAVVWQRDRSMLLEHSSGAASPAPAQAATPMPQATVASTPAQPGYPAPPPAYPTPAPAQ